MLARYNKARDLIQLGAYTPGHDGELDVAVQTHPRILALLQQDMRQRASLEESRQNLGAVAGA